MTPWHLRDRVRVLPGGDLVVKVVVFTLGSALIVLGLVLAVLPGPLTIPPMLLGLYVWSSEFAWAKRWFTVFKARGQQAWAAAKDRPRRAGFVTGGGIVLVVLVIVMASRYDWVDQARQAVS